MRYSSSCSACRVRKKRCVPSASGNDCVFCSSKQLTCDLANIKQNARRKGSAPSNGSQQMKPSPLSFDEWSSNDAVSPKQNQDYDILQLPVCSTLIDLYFDIFHNRQQILFHRESLIRERQADILPDYIVLGVIALTARFSRHEYFHDTRPCERASKYLSAALQSFNARDKLISMHSLQACILLSYVCFTEGQIEQESLLGAQAIRMVQMMNLPNLPAGDSIEDSVTRETRIRLFWQATMMDTWNSVRDQLPRQLKATLEMPKPMNEKIFEGLLNDGTTPDEVQALGTQDYSVWAQVVELTETFAEVTKVLITLVSHPSLVLQVESKTRAITSHLDNWLQSLCPPLQNTPENFQSAARLGFGREFAVIHLIYHHQCQLLYFPYLSRCTTDLSDKKTSEYIYRCKAHAEALSTLMWTTNTTVGMECLWSPVNGHLLVVASTVLLHALIFDHEDPTYTSLVKKLLEQNFVMLLQFQEYWPTLENALSRLQIFHQSCGRRQEQRNFQMDAWMLEFLLNYSSTLDRRPDLDEQQLTAAASASSTPRSDGRWDADTSWFELTDENIVRRSNLNALLSFV